MLHHIAWFNEAPVGPDAEGNLSSSDERVRRRCLVPARILETMKIDCSVFGNLHDADPAHVARHLQKLQTEIVVVSNINGLGLFQAARMAKHLGCYVVADFGAETVPEEVRIKYAALADQIVVASEPAAAALCLLNITALVIPDCDDGSTTPIATQLWFDCFQNLRTKPPSCANSNQPSDGHG